MGKVVKVHLRHDSNHKSRPSALWERCQQHEKQMPSRIASRMLHSAVIEPVSRRLWILGGLIKPVPIVYIYNLHTTTRGAIQSWKFGHNVER